MKISKIFNINKEFNKLYKEIRKCRLELTDKDYKSMIIKNISVCISNFNKAKVLRPELSYSSLILQIFIDVQTIIVKTHLQELKKYKIFKLKYKHTKEELLKIKEIHEKLIDKLFKFFDIFNKVLSGEIPIDDLKENIKKILPNDTKEIIDQLGELNEKLSKINIYDPNSIKELIQNQEEKIEKQEENIDISEPNKES